MSSKKYRLREDMKKKIKARLREKKAMPMPSLSASEVVNFEYHEALPNIPDKQTTLLIQDSDKTVKASRLPTIIDRLWRMNIKVTKPDKVNSPLHIPCYLPRNIKAGRKKKMSVCTELTPKRKKKRQSNIYCSKKLKTATNADFYFRFKTDPTEYSYTMKDTSETLKDSTSNNGVFKSYAGNQRLEDKLVEQRQSVSLFSKTPKLWKSLVRENNQYPYDYDKS